jgi:hypothetical protein
MNMTCINILKKPLDFKYKVTNAIVVIALTKKLAKHTNQTVLNQCGSIDIIQVHDIIDSETIKKTKKISRNLL